MIAGGAAARLVGGSESAPEGNDRGHFLSCCLLRSIYQLVPVPPSPLVSWNHGVGGNFRTWSLNHKDLY